MNLRDEQDFNLNTSRKHAMHYRLISFIALTTLLLSTTGNASGKLSVLPQLNWEPRSDWTSVKSCGATGDGKHDDTAAIQKAFDGIKRGVTIYFPPGTYRITQTLMINSPNKLALHGVLIVGHGSDSRIVWDGKQGLPMIQAEGMGYSRWLGLDLDGRNKASIGHYHKSMHTFETVHRKIHIAFRNFTRAGVYAEPSKDNFAMAETSFENCLFVNCGIGASFTQFNDYDITFEGCEFRQCGIGVQCIHGNYYVRNCHFEGSRIVDIQSEPEHGSSVRRTTSINSNKFIQHNNGVAPLCVENCSIDGWKDKKGAISISGAPAMLFDNVFTNAPDDNSGVVSLNHHQRLISSGNIFPENSTSYLKKGANAIYEIPTYNRKPLALNANQQFFTANVRIPGKVFDAKRDFGATGNGRHDDTLALQQTIDAAREHGKGAMAYLPSGKYVVKETLNVSGKDYYVGGAGLYSTFITWQGAVDGTTIMVTDSQNVTIEHLNLEKNQGIAILQKDTGKPLRVNYDGVFVTSRNKTDNPPYPPGILCQDLKEKSTVVMNCVVGNLEFVNSAKATILIPTSYYGSFVVSGKSSMDGLLGVLGRFSGGSYNVMIKDNNNVVMSDYYSENSGNILSFEGGGNSVPGRVTIQGAKLHLDKKNADTVIDIDNYHGQIFIGHNQFNGLPAGKISIDGKKSVELFIFATTFYHPTLEICKHEKAQIYLMGNKAAGKYNLSPDEMKAMFSDSIPPEKVSEIAYAIGDLHRLGIVDLELNYPHVNIH